MAALAKGTLALQRRIKAMTAAHAAELKGLQDSHAAELADVKGRAVTRIKELQAEVRSHDAAFLLRTLFFRCV